MVEREREEWGSLGESGYLIFGQIGVLRKDLENETYDISLEQEMERVTWRMGGYWKERWVLCNRDGRSKHRPQHMIQLDGQMQVGVTEGAQGKHLEGK